MLTNPQIFEFQGRLPPNHQHQQQQTPFSLSSLREPENKEIETSREKAMHGIFTVKKLEQQQSSSVSTKQQIIPFAPSSSSLNSVSLSSLNEEITKLENRLFGSDKKNNNKSNPIFLSTFVDKLKRRSEQVAASKSQQTSWMKDLKDAWAKLEQNLIRRKQLLSLSTSQEVDDNNDEAEVDHDGSNNWVIFDNNNPQTVLQSTIALCGEAEELRVSLAKTMQCIQDMRATSNNNNTTRSTIITSATPELLQQQNQELDKTEEKIAKMERDFVERRQRVLNQLKSLEEEVAKKGANFVLEWNE